MKVIFDKITVFLIFSRKSEEEKKNQSNAPWGIESSLSESLVLQSKNVNPSSKYHCCYFSVPNNKIHRL